uniref:EGF-like domain-containing protein n=1 Tax=Trichuris muris TaxID=70415 RepID=A0A5S6QQB8_TRIMR
MGAPHFLSLQIICSLYFLALPSHIVRQQNPLLKDAPFRRLSATDERSGMHNPQIEQSISSSSLRKAKMYPYGEHVHDHCIPPGVSVQGYVLTSELSLYGNDHSAIYISKDGALGFSPNFKSIEPNAFPIDHEVIAAFWTETSFDDMGNVHFRETADPHVVSLAASKVQSHFHFGKGFTPNSVFIATWERAAPKGRPANSVQLTNTFQVALVMSTNGTFAHFIYGELNWHGNATVGFNKGNERVHFMMPWSGSRDVLEVKEKTNMGIPGEWLFKLDDPLWIHLCAPGAKGIDCSSKCETNEFSYDCRRQCHCLHDEECNHVTGKCPSEICKGGWTNAPSCDVDIDECNTVKNACPESEPDCVNKAGTYECKCLLGYDKESNKCQGSQRNMKSTGNAVESSLYANTDRTKQAEAKKVNFSGQTLSQPVVFTPQQISEFVYNPFRPVPLQGVSHRNKVLTQSNAASMPNPLMIKPLTNFWPWLLPDQRTDSVTISCSKQCNRNSHCTLSNGTERCECNTGWTGDGYYCVDINECLQGNPCPANAKCINTNGSFECQCPSGFVSNGINCTDVDECMEGSARCPGGATSVCINTYGSYTCQCQHGYNGEPGSELGCVDVNECLLPRTYCGANAECKNTPGSYACECHPGFQPKLDGTNGCEDVDECQTKPCSAAAICINNVGSFKCICNATYNGNGFHCERSKLFPEGVMGADAILDRSRQWITVNLKSPLRFFLTDHNKLHISSNGVIGFDSPITTYQEPSTLGKALMPFYHKVDLDEGGKIYIRTITNGTFLLELITLFREVEGLKALRAHEVIIVTYENVKAHSYPESLGSTFQCVLVGFDIATYAIFIYDTVEQIEAKAGIQVTDSAKSVYLPFSGANAYELTVRSNIGIPGKWIYRIDMEYIPRCPSGYSDAPLCLSDIDECKLKELACHKNSICINTPGSYVCHCKRGYSGDGRQCFRIDPCYTESGAVCGENAQCFVPAFRRTKPECVCNDGFIGDGFFCTPIPDAIASNQEGRGNQLFYRSPTTIEAQIEQRTEKPMTVRLRSYRPPKNQEQEANNNGPSTQPPKKPSTNHPLRTFSFEDDLDVQNSSAFIYGTDSLNPQGSLQNESPTMKLLIIVVPTVLAVVWLSLIILLVKLCFQRRRNQQMARKCDYMEPFDSKQLSTMSSVAYESCGSLFNGYDFSETNPHEHRLRTRSGNVRYSYFD